VINTVLEFIDSTIINSSLIQFLVYQPTEGMVHPGLSLIWVVLVLFTMAVMIFLMPGRVSKNLTHPRLSFQKISFLGTVTKKIITRPYVITVFRIVLSVIFLLVIATGLFGTAIAERNLATMLTWTLWWSGVVVSIFFIGSAWCAICPWDAIATWIVRQRLWRRGSESSSLNLKVPKYIRNIWPAITMFIGLTWLELGVGITTSPYATALLALLIVVLTTISLAVYERKAFCRYFCPVGRTIGAYSGIAPVALRPINKSTCESCKTLECYHGTDTVEPCPTHLLMGNLKQSNYCTSCGACTQSCPKQNINWQFHPVGYEVTYVARPQWDESWFILGLLSLTLFHGFTMMSYWENWMQQLAYLIGDSGRLLISFTIGMILAILIPIALYSLCISWLRKMSNHVEWRRLFSIMAFTALPLAFSYHLAHNLSHLVRESVGFLDVVVNPFGTGTLPLSVQELHNRHLNPLVSDDIVFAFQSILLLFGFWLALKILRYRLSQLTSETINYSRWISAPMIVFITSVSLLSLWLLMQPMIMRM